MKEKEIKEYIENLKAGRKRVNLTRLDFKVGEEHGEIRRLGNRTVHAINDTVAYLQDLVPDEPSETVIIDNPKPDWMPLMICTIVDLPFNVGRDYTWEELEELVITLSLAGCDGIRIFGTGWKPFIEPFTEMVYGQYSFFKPNPTWDGTLMLFAELLHRYHMRLYVDLYDNCSMNTDWNPFATTRHGFSYGFYGYTEMIDTGRKDEDGKAIKVNEVDFMIEHWDNRVLACLDPDKDIVGLGNELRSHVENNAYERKIWAEIWGVKRAKNILDHRFGQPVPFSGSPKTAHKLHGYISAEEHKDDYGWTYRTSCNQIHGLGTPGHVAVWAEGGISQQRVFSYDDDGVGTNPDSKVPPSQRGYCEIRLNGSEYACTADTATRIETVKAFINVLKNRTYCFSIGFLPREILYKGKTVLSRFDVGISANIYWQLAQELWRLDIRRKRIE